MRAFAICATLAAFAPPPANAQITLGVHLATSHSAPGLNDSNPGLYIQLANGFIAGSYFNSWRRQSNYVGITLPVFDGAFDVSAVVLSGYRLDPMPAIVPSKRVSFGNGFGARISLLLPPNAASAVHFSVERTI